MIRLFVLDIDGCISYPFKSPVWHNIDKIRRFNELSRLDKSVPALSICSGRPHPYVEAVSQWLDIDHPVVFESGGGFYHVKSNDLQWHPVITKEVFRKNELLKEWVESEVIPHYPGMIREFSKKTDIGLVSSSEDDILFAYDKIRHYVSDNFPEYEVHHTEVSVNIIVRNCNKGEGLRYLSGMSGIPLAEMAYIGDSSGDITALKAVSRAFAPTNASKGVKEIAQVVNGETSDAIIAAYEIIIAENRQAT